MVCVSGHIGGHYERENEAGKKVDIKKIVTDYFELDDIQEALDKCVDNKAEIVKGVIKIN